jgi:uncharacterized protein YjiS (DUF1127 family)
MNMNFNNIQDPIARAEAMRAQAIANMLSNALTALGGVFKPVTAKLSAYAEFRRTFDTLAAMTDRELDDIGINRGDIRAVARGFDPRPQRTAMPGDALARRLELAEAFEQDNQPQVAAARANDNRTAVAA